MGTKVEEKATHTPGPWLLQDLDTIDGDRVVVVGSAPRHTRIVSFGPRKNWDEIDEGNANLIAAAPCLLAACESMLATCGSSADWQGYTHESLKLIEAAIAKAKAGA